MSGHEHVLPEVARTYNAKLRRRSVFAVSLIGVALVLGWWLAQGRDGLIGAAIGAAMVGAFFGSDVLLMRATRNLPPITTMAFVVMLYTFKITLLALFLVTLRGTDAFDAAAFATTVIGLSIAALSAALLVVGRSRTLSVQPTEQQ